MKASIVILNWNGGETNCAEAIESALAQTYGNKEIVFVDNGSSDGSGEAIRQRFPELTYIALPKNIGCPRGRNEGAEHAAGDLLFFLENDGVWDNPHLVASAVDLFKCHPSLGAVYTRVEGYETGSLDAPLDPHPPKDTRDGLYLSSSFRGGASIVRASLFAKFGGFPNDFFRQCEERFLSLLIYDRGYKVAYWPSFSLRHKGSDYAGKAAAVSSFNIENNLKIILRLYPIIPALLIGPSKWIVGMLGLLKHGRIKDALIITANLSKDFSSKRQYKRISSLTFRLVESLRQDALDDRSIETASKAKPLSTLLIKRLLCGA